MNKVWMAFCNNTLSVKTYRQLRAKFVSSYFKKYMCYLLKLNTKLTD